MDVLSIVGITTGYIAAGYIVATILAYIWNWCWCWVDDKEANSTNVFLNFVSKLVAFGAVYDNRLVINALMCSYGGRSGYEDRMVATTTGFSSSGVSRKTREEAEAIVGNRKIRSTGRLPPFFLGLFVFTSVPSVVAISITFYPIVLSSITLYAVAHLARFARRHKKLFDSHVTDKDAHKE